MPLTMTVYWAINNNNNSLFTYNLFVLFLFKLRDKGNYFVIPLNLYLMPKIPLN